MKKSAKFRGKFRDGLQQVPNQGLYMCILTIDQALYLLKEKSVRGSSAERVKTPSFAKPKVAIGLIGN